MTANQLPEALRRDFEEKLGDGLLQLYSIWDDIGIVQERREERINVVFFHLHNLLKDMLEEEKAMRGKMLARIDTYGEELIKLSAELKADHFQPDPKWTTLELERELRLKVETLSKLKHERMKQLKRLKTAEQALCDTLCMTPYYIPTGAVPTEDQLKELNQHIATLTKEQTKRKATFAERKKAIIDLETELERTPVSSLERELMSGNDGSFLLSTDNLNKMSALQKELEDTYKANHDLAGELRDRLDVLWNRLDVSDDERRTFNDQHTGFKPSIIQALREKIAECEALKLEHMEKFVTGVREELVSWWDKCYIPQTERDLFFPFRQEELSEDLLDAHDQEVQKLKTYHSANLDLFQKLDKRRTMFQLYKDLEAKARDPNRFNNRGGQLLLEEKQRKKLVKDLPKLESELRDQIKAWETEKGREFLIGGVHFDQFVESEWENLKHQKENEKLERKTKQARLMEEELMFGSKPVTPAKKRFTSTPSKTPNKFRKVTTPGMNSTSRTPASSSTLSSTRMTSMAAPNTPGLPPKSASKTGAHKPTPRRLRDTEQRRKSLQRRILTEKNATVNSTSVPEKSFSQTIITRSQENASSRPRPQDLSSFAPPGTEFSYRDFVQGISTDARSSILVLPPNAKDVHV